MSKIINISGVDAKYVTIRQDRLFEKKLQEFLSDIGIKRDRRKNLYKSRTNVYCGGDQTGWVGTLQVVRSEDYKINVEIFTGNDTIVLAIRGEDVRVGEMLLKHFTMSHQSL